MKTSPMTRLGTIPMLGALALFSLVLFTLPLVAGCGGKKAEEIGGHGNGTVESQPARIPPAPAAAPEGAFTIAGATFTPSAGWQDLGANGMRKAQYQLAPAEGDSDPAEIDVFYFGAGQGGDVDANLARWTGQVAAASGEEPERSSFSVDGMDAHVVSIDGTYKGGMGPAVGGGTAKDGYRLVGVVLGAPDGNVFFKLTGPVATAKAMEAGLMAMVKGARRAGS